MINSNMREYDYRLLQENDYGQYSLGEIKGRVKLSISILNKSITDSIKYSEASYLGLTYDRNVNDTMVIEYKNELLKVLYVNTDGRYTQVFLGDYG